MQKSGGRNRPKGSHRVGQGVVRTSLPSRTWGWALSTGMQALLPVWVARILGVFHLANNPSYQTIRLP
jgi:hypothetical protein